MKKTSEEKELLKILKKKLRKSGWLIEADAITPSIVTFIVGHPVSGSWWGHPKGNLIYNTTRALEEEKLVLCLKLVNGKRTFLYKNLWNYFYTRNLAQRLVAEKKLSPLAKKLWKNVQKIEKYSFVDIEDYKKLKNEVREIEKSLLCFVREVHLKSGTHCMELITFEKMFSE